MTDKICGFKYGHCSTLCNFFDEKSPRNCKIIDLMESLLDALKALKG